MLLSQLTGLTVYPEFHVEATKMSVCVQSVQHFFLVCNFHVSLATFLSECEEVFYYDVVIPLRLQFHFLSSTSSFHVLDSDNAGISGSRTSLQNTILETLEASGSEQL